MLPDTGERYLSTPLFEDIGVDMSNEELELSRSTPGYRFDMPSAPSASSPAEAPNDADAQRFVEQVIRDEPVVLFALEWCEFCWSVRRLFARAGIEYRSVDLDSVEYQRNDLGTRVRGVLSNATGSPTIPQIFVGGEHIGGCTELFDAWRDGTLQRRLADCRIPYDTRIEIDPQTLLPKWLQPRKSA
jgi:cysteine synthase A